MSQAPPLKYSRIPQPPLPPAPCTFPSSPPLLTSSPPLLSSSPPRISCSSSFAPRLLSSSPLPPSCDLEFLRPCLHAAIRENLILETHAGRGPWLHCQHQRQLPQVAPCLNCPFVCSRDFPFPCLPQPLPAAFTACMHVALDRVEGRKYFLCGSIRSDPSEDAEIFSEASALFIIPCPPSSDLPATV
ncbi:unnamed protein product [Closterium sp. NIES-54]